MKRTIYILLITTLLPIVTACNDDDSNNNNTNSLAGTAWFGTDDDEGEVYSFTSSTAYTFSGDGPTIQGTYTYNGSDGVLTETSSSYNFAIVSDVMTVGNGNSSIYIKQ